MGPAGLSSMARSIARPTAGGSGTRAILSPLPCTRRTRWPCSSPRSPMSLPVASSHHRHASRDGGRLESADLLEPAQVQLDVWARRGQRVKPV